MWGLFSKRSREQASTRPRRSIVLWQVGEIGGLYEGVLSLNTRDRIQAWCERCVAVSARHSRPVARRFARNSKDAPYVTASRQSPLLIIKRALHILQARITHRRSLSAHRRLAIIGNHFRFASCREATA